MENAVVTTKHSPYMSSDTNLQMYVNFSRFKNVAATSRRALNVNLTSVLYQITFTYLDSIATVLKASVENIKHVWKILRVLYEAPVTLKVNKFALFAVEFTTLATIFSPVVSSL